MSDNAAMDACLASTRGRWVQCDHKYCWDPEECTEQEYVEESTCSRDWTPLHAKADKCNTCGKIYTYP